MTSFTLSELATLCGARLEGDGSVAVTGAASLEEADADEVSFLAEARYRPHLETTRAAAVVVGEGVETSREGLALLRCADPGGAFNRIVVAFAPRPTPPDPGVHPSAVVDPSASVAAGAAVGPLCVVGPGARIGAGAILHALVTVGAQAQIGARTELHSGVVLYPHVRLGEQCLVHSGAVIGADGFGFDRTPEGWVKTPQGGTVIIEDDVEIGANVTIDCARLKATHIASNVKIDNLVHIAHNCRLGRSAMLLGQCGVSGSTRIGERVIIAGQAGLAGHLDIGDDARVGAASSVFRDVPAGEDFWGTPAGPKARAIKTIKALERLEGLLDEVRDLRKRVAELERSR